MKPICQNFTITIGIEVIIWKDRVTEEIKTQETGEMCHMGISTMYMLFWCSILAKSEARGIIVILPIKTCISRMVRQAINSKDATKCVTQLCNRLNNNKIYSCR